MKAVDHHLYSRKGHLYYRFILPRNLKSLLQRKEIKVSLSTQDIRLSRLYVAKLDIEIQNLINQLYVKIQSGDIINGFFDDEIEKIKQKVGLPQRQNLNAGLLSPDNIKSKPFSVVAKEYLADCVTNSPKTIEHKRQTYEIFQSIIGDIPFSQINKAHARKFKGVLVKTPANLTKITGVKSYLDIDWSNLPEAKIQSLVTVNNRLINMVALFAWAERNDLYATKNPFQDLYINKAKTNAAKRPPFSSEQLQILFSCPIYKGCKGIEPRNRMIKGEQIIKDYKYWIPLLGLYTGMRLNEICQLLVEDIQCLEALLHSFCHAGFADYPF